MTDIAMDEPRTGLPARSDAELLRLAAREGAGDEAFRELYRRHHGAVRGLLTRLLRDPQAAEDALQETFLRAHQHRARHDPARALRPWLLRVARNLGLNALRARGRRREAPVEAAPLAAADPVPLEAARREARDAAREALDGLPDEARALLIERHGLGLTLEELAESWELDERTIRTRLQAAADGLTRGLLRRRREEVSRDDV